MPLQQGKSKRSFVANIRELMHSFKRTGKIGTSTPASAAKANKQAVAIAYGEQRKSKQYGHGRPEASNMRRSSIEAGVTHER